MLERAQGDLVVDNSPGVGESAAAIRALGEPARLALVRDLDFDVLVPWGVTEGDPSFALVPDQRERRDRVDAIIGRVRAGGDR